MKPRWLSHAEKDIGQAEIKGSRHNQRILMFFRLIGQSWVKDDETPYCAAGVGAWLEESGIASTKKLNARSYLSWGRHVSAPALGSIVIFWRESPNSSKGHVGIIAGKTQKGDLVVLGANQKDKVCYASFTRERVLGYRYPIGEAVCMDALPVFTDVQLSTNEA
jgi:uncharacterized protein (TIGR02594 family)